MASNWPINNKLRKKICSTYPLALTVKHEEPLEVFFSWVSLLTLGIMQEMFYRPFQNFNFYFYRARTISVNDNDRGIFFDALAHCWISFLLLSLSLECLNSLFLSRAHFIALPFLNFVNFGSNFSGEKSSLLHPILPYITIFGRIFPFYVIWGPQNGQK